MLRGDAHEPGGGGKGVFFIFIRQRSRDEHERTVRANHKKRWCHLAAVAQAEPGIMLGLSKQVVERFKLAGRLQRRNFREHKITGQERTEKFFAWKVLMGLIKSIHPPAARSAIETKETNLIL